MKRYHLWLGILVLLMMPKEAWMSGPFTGHWADQYYLLSYEEQGRKIFMNDEQASNYMAKYNEVFLEKAFLTLPQRLRIVNKAKKRSILIVPIDPGTSRLDLWQNEDLKRLPQTYPCLFSFPIETKGGNYRVTICLQKAVSGEQYKWLTGELAEVLGAPLDRNKTVESKLPEVRRIQEYYLGEYFGLYVGLDHQMVPEAVAQYQVVAEKAMKALAQIMECKLKEPAFLHALGSKPELLKPYVEKAKQAGAMSEHIFRPDGPSLDDAFPGLASIHGQKGYLKLVVLAKFRNLDWGKVSGVLEKVLNDFSSTQLPK